MITTNLEGKLLSFMEACEYLGYSKSYMYKLTHSGILPFTKPNGGRLFFDKEKLNQWASQNQSSTLAEREIAASTYISINS